ncbi:MAG: hypothetical protein M3Q78_12715, partial [Acidobacteriota bacterium]|nr:hypothetical protein [Acidobacteriota bacterium]
VLTVNDFLKITLIPSLSMVWSGRFSSLSLVVTKIVLVKGGEAAVEDYRRWLKCYLFCVKIRIMLQTIEAIIETSGEVRLLEELRVTKPTRALVTVLENGDRANTGNVSSVLELMQNPEFKNRRSYPAEQIEAQIEDARNSWE